MGTTKTAIQNGDNPRLVFTIAIEGYQNLITSHDDTSAIITAFAATDYAACIRGLKRPEEITQAITPFRPRLDSASTTFVVMPDEDDTFGVDVFSSDRSTGNYGRLSASVDAQASNISMGSSADLGGVGESAYIGTERVTIVSNSGTAIIAARGIPAPFGVESTGRFGRAHTVSQVAGGRVGYPYATDWKRIWIGSWIGCWCSKVDPDGTVDTVAESELIFAGRISDLQDSEGNATIVTATDARDITESTILMNDQFSATPKEGVRIEDGDKFKISTIHWVGGSPTFNTATMTVGTGGYLDAGVVNAADVLEGLSNWYQDNAITDIQFIFATIAGNVSYIRCRMDIASIEAGRFTFRCPAHIAGLLGFDIENPTTRVDAGESDQGQPIYSSQVEGPDGAGDVVTYLRTPFTQAHSLTVGAFDSTWKLQAPTGTFVDQGDYVPSPWKGLHSTGTGTWGFLNFGGLTILVKRTDDETFTTYYDPQIARAFDEEKPKPIKLDSEFGTVLADNSRFIRVGDGLPRVKQVIVMEGELDDLVTRIFASTGAANYNESTVGYDSLDAQLGAAVPWDLLGDNFVNSLESIANFSDNKTFTLVLDKPTKLSDVLISELAMRNAHLVFRDGGLVFVTPSTVISTTATHTLTVSDKAAPPGQAHQDPPQVVRSRDTIINSIKLEFNRRFDGRYMDTIEVSNQQSKTDYGHAAPLTIKARNAYGLGRASFSQGIRELVPLLAGDALAFWSKPLPRVRRSIAAAKWFMAPGDSVSFTDNFIRDPQSGTRTVSELPAWPVSVVQNWTTMRGEVELVLQGDDSSRRVIYSPAAKLASYSAPTITCEASEFSLASEAADASHFEAGDLIYVIEASPATIGSPVLWSRTIDSVSGNDITLTSGLSSPAFDSNLDYYIISQDRSTAQTSQKADCYIGDDGDGKIANDVRNRLWTTQPTVVLAIDDAVTTERHEWPVDDGKWDTEDFPVHPAMHRAAVKTANNLINRRTAAHAPIMFSAAATHTDTDFSVLMFPFPFYFGDGESAARKRQLTIGPRVQMSAAVTGTIRVTSSASPPISETAIGGSVEVTFSGPTQQLEFTHATTTMTNVTASTLDIASISGAPFTWITVEAKVASGTMTFRGWHTFHLGPLVTV